jgi:rod shape-determining protein MreD
VVIAGFVASPWVRAPLVIIAVLAVQTGIVAGIRPFDVTPDLMLLLAVASGLALGPERGAILGASIGFVFDLVLSTPFGLSALVYGLAAFAVGLVSTGTLEASRWVPMLLTAAASAGAVVLYAVLGSMFGLERAVTLRLVPTVLVVSVVNGALAVPAMAVMRWALHADDRRL